MDRFEGEIIISWIDEEGVRHVEVLKGEPKCCVN